jgi:hypothetical protein
MFYFIPIGTALFAAFFFVELIQHWRQNKAPHVLWWAMGIFVYGAGCVSEGINAIWGFSETNFKAWYILGAILGGCTLAQGTVYLMLKRRTANILSVILSTIITTAIILVILSPIQPVTDINTKLSGKLLQWTFIRGITPFLNIYGFLFLVVGAIYSAIQYYRTMTDKSKCWGNVLIAAGGLLPAVGGTSSKFGHIEVLYITEFIGICLIHLGYQRMKQSAMPSIYSNQQEVF